ncbi:MAG: preprotein translocase subunit YajC [Sphingomonadaceae bacterium]|nr:preprotein translocase subunit YajC [Sphingomonadaceae bacterium]
MFISPAYAQAAAGAPSGSAFAIQMVPLLLLFVIFWVLIIRPSQVRARAHRAMLDSVKRGDEVVVGGLIGRVTKVGDTELDVELAKGVTARVVKAMVSEVRPRGAPAPANDAKA